MKKRIWISWENHRRSQTICDSMNIKLFEIIDSTNLFIIRYIILLVKTSTIILREKPNYIFVMNPSIVLALFIVFWGKIFNKPIIVDAHNIGVHFEHSDSHFARIIQFFNVLVMRYAELTIVTNRELARYIHQKKGTPFILPDPFPKFKNFQNIKLQGMKNIFYICTYSEDEPYMNVIESVKYFKSDVKIYISGQTKKKISHLNLQNIIMTGYLPEQDFINYLFSSDVVLDLTYRENCLLCGAYETIAAEKPLILSKTKALQDYFKEAALFTDNTASDIAAQIKIALHNEHSLVEKIKIFKNKQSCRIMGQLNKLEKIIQSF